MSAFFRLPAAGLMFFVSAWLVMIFAGIVASDVGIKPFGYTTSIVVTIGLWLVMTPAVGAIAGSPGSKPGSGSHRPQRKPPAGAIVIDASLVRDGCPYPAALCPRRKLKRASATRMPGTSSGRGPPAMPVLIVPAS